MIHPAQLLFGKMQSSTGSGNQDESVERPVDPIELELQGKLRHQPRGSEAVIVGRGEEEAQQSLKVHRVARAAEGKAWPFIGRDTVARRMAQRAIHRDPLVADALDRQAHGKLFTLLPDETERFVAAMAKLFRTEAIFRIFLDQIGKNTR